MTVSKVREGVDERLGAFWVAPRHAESTRRAEALQWARRQLAWERRLAALRGSQTRSENRRPLDPSEDLVLDGSQAAQAG